MLGKKEYGQDKATLSQGIFAQSVMMLYSKKPDEDKKNLEHSNKLQDDGTPLRKFFLSERDDALLKILFNCFNALKNVFNEEWKEPDTNILWKSTGFRGVMKALPTIISKGVEYKVLTQDFFNSILLILNKTMERMNLLLIVMDREKQHRINYVKNTQFNGFF